MKKLVLSFLISTVLTSTAFAQEQVTPKDSTAVLANAEQQRLAVIAKVEQAEKDVKAAEKATKKAEKAEKKAEKLEKQLKKLQDDIADTRKDIVKDERKIIKLEADMEQDKLKGKLSPNDILKTNKKVIELKEGILKSKSKLRKLERKQ